jgi:L-lactate dehydrogenase complex protein LldG
MTNPSPTRQAILARIRGPHAATTAQLAAEEYSEIPRPYIRAGALTPDRLIDLFEERLGEYDARVHRVTEATLPNVIAAAIGERGARHIAIPAGIPPSWLPANIAFTEAGHLSNLALNQFDGVLSACTVAIALTGTIVLQNAPAQGPRKLSLVPDYHLCVVHAGQIVETVSEAFDRLAPTSTLPTTFISGPSATADIEMTRIKGVHGPRFLDVLIVVGSLCWAFS